MVRRRSLGLADNGLSSRPVNGPCRLLACLVETVACLPGKATVDEEALCVGDSMPAAFG